MARTRALKSRQRTEPLARVASVVVATWRDFLLAQKIAMTPNSEPFRSGQFCNIAAISELIVARRATLHQAYSRAQMHRRHPAHERDAGFGYAKVSLCD